MQKQEPNFATNSSLPRHPVSFCVFCSAIAGTGCGYFPLGPLEKDWLWQTLVFTVFMFLLPSTNFNNHQRWIIAQIIICIKELLNGFFLPLGVMPHLGKLKTVIIEMNRILVCAFFLWALLCVIPWVIGEWKGGIMNSLIGGIIGAIEGRLYYFIFYRIYPLHYLYGNPRPKGNHLKENPSSKTEPPLA